MAASFGEQLRLAREARGVTLRQISDQTHISIRYLEAIEADDYKQLPGGIFNRSFIKAYAKHIGFDEKEAVEGYMRTAREQGESPDDVATTPYKSHVYTDGGTRSPLVTLLLTILVLAILSLGVYAALHWYQRREANRDTNNNPPAPNTQGEKVNSSTAPPVTPPAPAAPTDKLQVDITARGEDVYISAWIDDSKKSTGTLLKPDQTEKFDAKERLRLTYARVKAKALEVIINGRKATVPADKTEMIITREGYEQFLQ
jgi:cytoskeletal protein RodZ